MFVFRVWVSSVHFRLRRNWQGQRSEFKYSVFVFILLFGVRPLDMFRFADGFVHVRLDALTSWCVLDLYLDVFMFAWTLCYKPCSSRALLVRKANG